MLNPMLKDLIDWPNVMKQPRCAGGHSDIMENLFADAEILARYREDDWQGQQGYIYLVWHETDYAKIVLITDYFGSCSGCDSWEDASDDDIKASCETLANNAKIFDSVEEAKDFLQKLIGGEDKYAYYGISCVAKGLLEDLERNIAGK